MQEPHMVSELDHYYLQLVIILRSLYFSPYENFKNSNDGNVFYTIVNSKLFLYKMHTYVFEVCGVSVYVHCVCGIIIQSRVISPKMKQ